jgi:hypothetical protein
MQFTLPYSLSDNMKRSAPQESSKQMHERPLKMHDMDLVVCPNRNQSSSFHDLHPVTKKNGVRFHIGLADESVIVQVIETLIPASEMSAEEKDARWYPTVSLHENALQAQHFAYRFAILGLVDLDLRHYSKSLSTTYASCAGHEIYHEHASEQFAQKLALSEVGYISMAGDSTRGLEKILAPVLGQDMRRRRKETIDSVLMVHRALREECSSSDDKNELLCKISEVHSTCSRRYAKTMGTADAMSALLEYGGSTSSSSEDFSQSNTRPETAGSEATFEAGSMRLSAL